MVTVDYLWLRACITNTVRTTTTAAIGQKKRFHPMYIASVYHAGKSKVRHTVKWGNEMTECWAD